MHKVSVLTVMVMLSACSSDYQPAASANGETIFKEVCAECHQPENPAVPQVIFTLHAKIANPTYITHKVQGGSLLMPKFKKITGSKMRSLAEYVLNHTVTE